MAQLTLRLKWSKGVEQEHSLTFLKVFQSRAMEANSEYAAFSAWWDNSWFWNEKTTLTTTCASIS